MRRFHATSAAIIEDTGRIMPRAIGYCNTTGPCRPETRSIRDQLSWAPHAPKPTGKTTFLQSWMREINAGDEALACYVSVGCCQAFP
ncbi:MAG: hypothetical protein LBU39_06565 [Desulfobulbaceae bacterium]|nr:hypothetical protein [Desulfobulbaceae bacterium]